MSLGVRRIHVSNSNYTFLFDEFFLYPKYRVKHNQIPENECLIPLLPTAFICILRRNTEFFGSEVLRHTLLFFKESS